MVSDHKTDKETVSNRTEPQSLNLTRLKWLDPLDRQRFIRKESGILGGGSNEALLESIYRFTDEIFDALSVFEQFPETTARGAPVSAADRQIDSSFARAGLLRAERELWDICSDLRARRNEFMQSQMKSLGVGVLSKGLKLHIGAAGGLIDDWINIDAGGADLSMNVNWGLPFPDSSSAYVYCAHMLEHLRYNDQAPVFVREVYRILDKGGTVRFVVPDLRKLLTAYVHNDRDYFLGRHVFYPLSEGFMHAGVATLDYVLLYCGVGPQALNYNHKFGYDSTTLCKLLLDAGFSQARESSYMMSEHSELRIDNYSYDSQVESDHSGHYSLFVEATK